MKNDNKSKYKVRLSIEAEVETSNPYEEKDMGVLVIYTLIQNNIENLTNKIENIEGFEKAVEQSDYLIELKEQKNILTSLINENLSLSIEKIETKNKISHLKIIK
jgi:hypothetical protein